MARQTHAATALHLRLQPCCAAPNYKSDNNLLVTVSAEHSIQPPCKCTATSIINSREKQQRPLAKGSMQIQMPHGEGAKNPSKASFICCTCQLLHYARGCNCQARLGNGLVQQPIQHTSRIHFLPYGSLLLCSVSALLTKNKKS
jgi:hypothetical protein